MSMSRVILLLVGLNTVITVGAVVGGYLYLRPMINGTPAGVAQPGSDLAFYPIEKVIVNLLGHGRERYVVLDLALQADTRLKADTLKQIEPLVRHSVISSLSQLTFEELRQLGIDQVQGRIETRLREDFASKGLTAPFSGALVSKLLVQ
ncbi:flagellar basal body-associated FliL family protein [Pseudomonas sp. DSV-1]|uniref:flagellar basal body-associated FliL family protein n=1 Tax=Pseudomonas sp. DSV-1 TaxID=3112250 RepID=UPI002DB73ACA|nr:flagellar basal body-associated FliL family protein [Pseudomonas sp. DSV-1]MEC4239901.1 flagellar basal body-associated FliL family protein [Pseudomonas sp. DSV-1]